jgi:hypothetical protein
MKKVNQVSVLHNKEFVKNKNNIDSKNKTTNINILLNRVKINKKKNFRKKITLTIFLILTLSAFGLIVLT